MMLCAKAEPGHELLDPRQPRQQVPASPDSVETPALRWVGMCTCVCGRVCVCVWACVCVCARTQLCV